MDKKFAQELAAAIDAELLFSNWRFYALTLALLLVSKAVDVYIAHYWAKRAEVKAAGADLSEVVRQLRATTNATEAVRTEILKADWLDKEWRSIRRLKLEELLVSANGMLASLGIQSIDEPDVAKNEDSERMKMLCALYFPELRDEVTHIYTMYKLNRIHFLESKTALMEATSPTSTEDIKKDYRQKKAVLYQQFLQALFDLEKAAAALMQRVSMHDNQS